jgi:DNA repair protein RecO (recombination protein O)
LLALARGEPPRVGQRREARDLLRRLLEPHLGPRPLRSRELFHVWSAATPVAAGPAHLDPPRPTSSPLHSEPST